MAEPVVLVAAAPACARPRRTPRSSAAPTPSSEAAAVIADQLAEAAVQAAERRHTSLPGEKPTARWVRTLAKEAPTLHQQVAELDKAIEARFRDHHTFDVITGMPGLGIILGAEFPAATGGDMGIFGTPKPSSRSPAAAPTSSGLSSAMDGATSTRRPSLSRLDRRHQGSVSRVRNSPVSRLSEAEFPVRGIFWQMSALGFLCS